MTMLAAASGSRAGTGASRPARKPSGISHPYLRACGFVFGQVTWRFHACVYAPERFGAISACAETHSHGLPLNLNGGTVSQGADVTVFPPGNYTSDPAPSLPPYVDMVWIIKVK